MRAATGGRPAPSRPGHAVGAVLAALTAALTAAFVAAAGIRSDPIPAGAGGWATATVPPGGTLWEVAVAHAAEGSDPREYLHRLRAANRLDDVRVPPWTVVVLPPP